MRQDAARLHRRAVVAAFQTHLTAEQLAQALQQLSVCRLSPSIADIIAYVDQVARLTFLENSLCKRLYGELFRTLGQAESTLPPDPWQDRTVAPAVSPVLPPAVPVPAAPPLPPAAVIRPAAPAMAVVPALAQEAAASEPVVVPSAPVTPPATPAQAVFAALLKHAQGQMGQSYPARQAELQADIRSHLVRAGKKLPAESCQQFWQVWEQAGGPAAWIIPADAAVLSGLLHLFYQALCDTLGPVNADQVLTRAVQAAGQIPEAAAFSPGRLL